MKTRWRPFRRDRLSIGHVPPGTLRAIQHCAGDMIQRTRGEVSGVSRIGFHVRSGIFILGHDAPQEYLLPIGFDRAGVWKASERPIVVANLGGVACVSLAGLVREFPGIAPALELIFDHVGADERIREVPFSAFDTLTGQHKVSVLTMVSLAHVADCLYLLGRRLESAHAEFIKAFSMLPELRPYVDYDRFIFAAGDPYCRAPLFSQRDEAWRVASIIAPHWGRWFQPHEVSTLAIPADDLARIATVVARKTASNGFETARASASGLVEVRDARVREVAVPGGSIRLQFIGDRLFVVAASLLRLADRGVTLETVEEAVTCAAAKGLPGGALHRSNAQMSRGRPPVGSWWLDVVEARSFLAMSGYPAPTGAAATFLDEVDARIKPGMHRDLCGTLPQTGPDGEVVLGMIVKGKLMPIMVDDHGVPWLSQVQIGAFGDWTKGAVTRAVQRLGLVVGGPGVVRRRSLAVDGKDRVQVHYDLAACLRIGVELRSFDMVTALSGFSSFMGALGVGQTQLETLKAVPAVERVIEIELGS